MKSWQIRIETDRKHHSQQGWRYWYRRWFIRWFYPHGVRLAILPGTDEHYVHLYDWILLNVPDHADSVWLVLDHLLVDDLCMNKYLCGEIRFRSKEIHTAFLLRFSVDTELGRVII